jgi:dihydrofolate synthase/folylpolyglutamate synthase
LITEIRVPLDEMVREGVEHPTEFEVTTALALLYFARQQVDIAILEAGLGGSD